MPAEDAPTSTATPEPTEVDSGSGEGWSFPLPDIVLPSGTGEARLFARWTHAGGWTDVEAAARGDQGEALAAAAADALSYGPTAPDAPRDPPLGYCFKVMFSSEAAKVQVQPLTDIRLRERSACLRHR